MHVLDRPVWHALTGRQAAVAIGTAQAVRMAAAYGPFGAAADGSTAAMNALAALVRQSGPVWVVGDEQYGIPDGLALVRQALCVQMVAQRIIAAPATFTFEALGDDDAAAMAALAHLTVPGPFHPKTHQLGRFIGVRIDRHLIAMAGERLRPEGHIEVSCVCTHPDHRGKGHAAGLMRAVAQRIADEGQRPFLHAYADNAGAIALYESLGFVIRRTIVATVLDRL